MSTHTKTKKLQKRRIKGCFNLYSNRKWEEIVQDGGLGKAFFSRDDIIQSISILTPFFLPERHV